MEARNAAYHRVSPTESKRNETIEIQRYQTEQFSQQTGIHFAEIYEDNMVTGTLPMEKRPAGSRLLLDAMAGRFHILYVWKIDRLARTTLEGLLAARQLKEQGIYVVSISENLDNRTSDGEWRMTLMLSLAQMERDRILERTGAGRDRIARLGMYYGGRVAYGYAIVERRWALHPVHSGVVARIYVLYLEFASMRRVARTLTAEGIPPPRGVSWNEGTVRNILSNSIYCGTAIYKKKRRVRKNGEVVGLVPYDTKDQTPIEVPAIVSVADFEQVRSLREEGPNTGRKPVHTYLLSRLVYCHCGYKMSGSASHADGKTFLYYRHSGDPTDCGQRKIRADMLESQVWEQVAALLRDPGDLIRRIHEGVQQVEDESEEERQIERQLLSRPEERKRVITLLTRRIITEEDADQQLRRIESEVHILTERLALLTDRSGRRREATLQAEGIEETILRLAHETDHGSFSRKQEVLRTLLEKVVIEADGFRLVPRFPRLTVPGPIVKLMWEYFAIHTGIFPARTPKKTPTFP